ncbi:type I-D CRISPR-associated protein Cas7/Csc2 [Candidatus Poribacteria bacterium]|nr:type I-D CRISPR-associated protein Cas7/Csc2 [Candidatus Poribacteria bacterium]
MQVSEIESLNRYNKHFQSQIPRFKEGKYIQIIVLRETKSHAIFTTEGQNLHVEKIPAGIKNQNSIERPVMYKRKQIAPERRTGKALLRQFNLCPPCNIENKSGKVVVPRAECQIFGKACGVCPDCIIYGFVTTSGKRANSQKSRVLTDSGFIVRDIKKVMKDIKLNAIDETTSSRLASGAYSHRENLLPEVFIPTVETLVDVTKEEFVYVLGNILKTTRYGAEAGREGFIRNHIIGIYFSDVEVFSNLEMSQVFYDILSDGNSIPDCLTLQDFTQNFVPVANECIGKSLGRITMMTDIEIQELIHDIGIIYSDPQYLSIYFQKLSDASLNYALNMQDSGNDTNRKDKPVAM